MNDRQDSLSLIRQLEIEAEERAARRERDIREFEARNSRKGTDGMKKE